MNPHHRRHGARGGDGEAPHQHWEPTEGRTSRRRRRPTVLSDTCHFFFGLTCGKRKNCVETAGQCGRFIHEMKVATQSRAPKLRAVIPPKTIRTEGHLKSASSPASNGFVGASFHSHYCKARRMMAPAGRRYNRSPGYAGGCLLPSVVEIPTQATLVHWSHEYHVARRNDDRRNVGDGAREDAQ